MAKSRVEIIFSDRTFTVARFLGEARLDVRCGLYLDLDDLELLVYKASKNKSRKAKDGPLRVEIHHVNKLV